ncbi:hypothetical protein SV7mr_45420 [Stieleria bergensis]|uniref:Uncharacterized protein n=1 Tax=Stieleria bergensis TaxID=2528025 RepID=A0A517T0Y5_9BACT|nr:hypothetical protein SV7mr_45420 [Planctomycetes bacterium SV_7m_r]
MIAVAPATRSRGPREARDPAKREQAVKPHPLSLFLVSAVSGKMLRLSAHHSPTAVYPPIAKILWHRLLGNLMTSRQFKRLWIKLETTKVV